MDTPYLPQRLFAEDFKKVYEPAEDSFLLLDALENDLDYLETNGFVCLEIGSGSGIITTALSKAFKNKDRLLITTDINPAACKTTKKCANFHGEKNIQVIQTNLAEALIDRLENQVDVLIFNPPYVPTDSEENLKTSQEIQLSWAGGNQGRRLTDVFLETHVPKLLSKPDGVLYLIALEQNNITQLLNYLVDEYKIRGSIVKQRKAGIELLYVLKYSWIKNS